MGLPLGTHRRGKADAFGKDGETYSPAAEVRTT